MMMRAALFFLLSIFFLTACLPSSSNGLPTLAPTIAIPTITPLPTNTPAPTPTFAVHSSPESLVENVAGIMLVKGSLKVERYYEYGGEPYPDGRVGYDIDFSVFSPFSFSRDEMLQLAYTLQNEFYRNFRDDNLMYIVLHMRGDEFDPNCTFGLGIGYRSVNSYLPADNPLNLDEWFNALVIKGYYGDLPGETEALLAYGNDPENMPLCTIEDWKR